NPAGLNNLLQKDAAQIRTKDVESELVDDPSGIQLLLASYRPADARRLSGVDQFAAVVDQLAHLAAFTILDLGPAIPPHSDRLLESCDQLIVVVEPDPNAAVHAKALLDDLGLRVLSRDRISVAVVNRVRTDQKLSRTQIQDLLGHPAPYVFTPVPEIAYQAARTKVPMVLLGDAAAQTQQHNNIQQYSAIAGAIARQGQKVSV
ncbi:MAG TPA: hypothetical protein VJ768_10370, partial [Anaerolineales bacterium]|nr:hypothetical protein [Anaerolineales bacterium]